MCAVVFGKNVYNERKKEEDGRAVPAYSLSRSPTSAFPHNSGRIDLFIN